MRGAAPGTSCEVQKAGRASKGGSQKVVLEGFSGGVSRGPYGVRARKVCVDVFVFFWRGLWGGGRVGKGGRICLFHRNHI